MARVLAVLPTVLAAPAPAAEVYLRDGSVVIGTIESLADGVDLTVDTAHMGDVVIGWDAIERIEGTAAVNVELFSGERLVGNPSPEEGRLYVGALDTPGGRTIETEQVFQIDKYTDDWTDGVDADLTLGLKLLRGIIDDARVTLEISRDRVAGRATCNTYTGYWSLEDGRLSIGDTAVTRRSSSTRRNCSSGRSTSTRAPPTSIPGLA